MIYKIKDKIVNEIQYLLQDEEGDHCHLDVCELLETKFEQNILELGYIPEYTKIRLSDGWGEDFPFTVDNEHFELCERLIINLK